MCSKRDAIIFLAGAQTFHTLSHIFLMYSNALPITAFGITITAEMNNVITIANVVVTVALIWWAMQIPHDKKSWWASMFKSK